MVAVSMATSKALERDFRHIATRCHADAERGRKLVRLNNDRMGRVFFHIL
jgi:hypothetical protein